MTFVAQRLLPRLDAPIVLFTTSRDITLPLQRTCGGDPVDGHCKYDDYTVEQQLVVPKTSGYVCPIALSMAQGCRNQSSHAMPLPGFGTWQEAKHPSHHQLTESRALGGGESGPAAST